MRGRQHSHGIDAHSTGGGHGISAYSEGGGAGLDAALSGATLASFFLTPSGQTAAAAVAGSVLAETVNAVWDEALTGGTHNVSNSAGKRLREMSGTDYTVSAVPAPTASTFGTSVAQPADGWFNGEVLQFTSARCRASPASCGTTRARAAW